MFKKNDLYGDWLGKRVILFTSKSTEVNYVGTLKAAHGTLIKLVNVTPRRDTRKMRDMIANLSSPRFDTLELLADEPFEDPTGSKK
jgi:hypothetical protein